MSPDWAKPRKGSYATTKEKHDYIDLSKPARDPLNNEVLGQTLYVLVSHRRMQTFGLSRPLLDVLIILRK